MGGSPLEKAMQEKFGQSSGANCYTESLQLLQPLVDQHPDWFMKRMGGHRWEVRNGVKDKTYYGVTLCEALCRALLET